MLATRIRQSPSGPVIAQKVVDFVTPGPVPAAFGTIASVELSLVSDPATENLSVESIALAVASAALNLSINATTGGRLRITSLEVPATPALNLPLTASLSNALFYLATTAGSGSLTMPNGRVLVEFQVQGTGTISDGSMVALVQ